MRIVIDLQCCQNGSRHRGIGRYAMALTKALIQERRDHEILIFLSDRYPDMIPGIRAELEGLLPQQAIFVCNFPARTSSADPDNAWRTRAAEIIRTEFLTALAPDMVFVPSIFEGFWDDAVASVDEAPFKTAITLHDLIPLEEPQRYIPAQGDQDAYARKLRDVRNADLVAAISSFTANSAIAWLQVDPKRVLVSLNGVDEQFRRPAPREIDRASLLRRHGIVRPFVFNTSPLEYRKNIEGLIAGYASMSPATRESHQLVIVGKMDDYARKYLAGLVEVEGLPADTLVLPGYVSEADLVALYAECALFCFPSLSEGFGLPPLEAMACGAPVIASNATSLPEVVGREDLLVSPTDPRALGAAIERVLIDPDLQLELRDFGVRRARLFSWRTTASGLIDAFEQTCMIARTAPERQVRNGRKARLAILLPATDPDGTLAGKCAALLPALARVADITIVRATDAPREPWLDATFDRRDLDWLDRNAASFDVMVYVVQRSIDDAVAERMTIYPGIVLRLHEPVNSAPVVATGRTLPRSSQRMLVAAGGIGLLSSVVAGTIRGDDLPDPLQAFLEAMGCELLTEHGRPNGLPLLPLTNSRHAGAALRTRIGVPEDAPLVFAVAPDEEAGARLIAQFRAAVSKRAGLHLALHVANGTNREGSQGKPLHGAGHVRRLTGPLAPDYRGLLSAADLILTSGGLDNDLLARLETDTRLLHLPVIADADCDPHLADRIVSEPLPSNRVRPIAGSLVDPAIDQWVERIGERVADWQGRAPSMLGRVAARLPAIVRDMRPDSGDLHQIAASVSSNAALERAPRTFVDLTAYARVGATRRLDGIARTQLHSLLERGGTGIQPVRADGGRLVCANRFVGHVLGVTDFLLTDDIVEIRPGDRIVGLDVFHGFEGEESLRALERAQAYGAALVYIAAGQSGLTAAAEQHLAGFVMAVAETASPSMRGTLATPRAASPDGTIDTRVATIVRQAAARNVSLQVIALDGAPLDAVLGLARSTLPAAVHSAWETLTEEAAPLAATVEPGFAVMGHLLGSYSLAIINRAVATTLEENMPGRVRFLAYETDQIAHTEGVPIDEQPLMIELCARPTPSEGDEVVISQHWPVMPPKGPFRLALSLFAWEESHLPDAIVRRLNEGFDAIIAPARTVSDALSVSGVRLPIAIIGQPVDLGPFAAVGSTRARSGPVRKFLHVSSCFRRKGIDVLLAAWARAFTDADDVVLVIKTFPNPHNDVEARVAALRTQHPRLAPIEIVNRDATRSEMAVFYADADVMVLPTRGEGYNLPALEAMAAGLPLIVTGHGGHRDFCGPNEARMITYRFARSESHVAGHHSMWVEPDEGDLIAALREYADPANGARIEGRRANGLTAAALEGDNVAWVRRLRGMVQSLLRPGDVSAPRICWVSTWQIQCGIAQYSNYLIERMSSATRARMTVLSDFRTGMQAAAGIEHENAWNLIGDKAGEIMRAALARRAEALLIQHQDGLISWEQLGRIGQDPVLGTMVSVVILHNARNLRRVGGEELAMVVAGLKHFTRVLVHNMDDLNYLTGLGLARNVGLFPHGALAPETAPWPRLLDQEAAPLIGCHGFFFRHKGIDKLIRAAAILRQEWPRLRLRLVNARFPDPGHDQVIEEARAIAREVGMEDAIEWELDFLSVERIEKLLSECDVIALPYEESDDSASGAVRTALATMVPLIVTRVQIFAELDDAAAWADSNDPMELAREIAALLRDPRRRREVQAGMHDWLKAHDWRRMATSLEDMLNGLVRARRLEWHEARSNF